MKKISFWLLLSFSFFFIGELLWSIRLIWGYSILDSEHTHDLLVNLMFVFC